MAAESGSGAATNSGIRYQNRVAAYLLATALCGQPTRALEGKRISEIGFETTEEVDDLNVVADGESLYLQVKRNLSFSVSAAAELRKTLAQFLAQHISHNFGRYFLVTTGESSRKISLDMRVALDSYRSSSSTAFYRDQAQAITGTIEKLRETLAFLAREKNCVEPDAVANEVLRRMHVSVVDIDENSPLEQATVLILAARGYLTPELFWAKLVSDCLTHSTRRNTVSIATESTKYAQFVFRDTVIEASNDGDFLKVEYGAFDFPVGREVILGKLSDANGPMHDTQKLVLMEFRRFDEDCQTRLRFDGNRCYLDNGLVIEVLRRAATVTGLSRYIDRHPEVMEGKELLIFESNFSDDLQKGLCAELHLRKLRAAALSNASLLTCMRCGRHVSSLTAEIVELDGTHLRVGLIHDECLHPTDRLLGTIQNNFFKKFSFLVNFDVNGWFRAIERGQGLFSTGLHERQESVIGWGGRKPEFASGDFLIEFLLANGENEYCCERGKIHRFTKLEADAFADQLNASVAIAAARNDPLCYSDQSRAFGTRSQLMELLGVKENLREISSSRAIPYEVEIANRNEFWSNWYAPLLFLQSPNDGAIFLIGNVVPILTNPLDLNKYLENWKAAGIELDSYQTTIIYSDRDFDDFMSQVEDDGLYPLVNPLLDPSKKDGFSRGTLIRSLSKLLEDRKASR